MFGLLQPTICCTLDNSSWTTEDNQAIGPSRTKTINIFSFIQVTLQTLLAISYQSYIDGQRTCCPPSQTNIQTCHNVPNDGLQISRARRVVTDLNKNLKVTRYDIANIKINVSNVDDKIDKVADKIDKIADMVDGLSRQVSEIANSVGEFNKIIGESSKNLTRLTTVSTILTDTSSNLGMTLIAV